MKKSRRATYIWLVLLGLAVGLIALASTGTPDSMPAVNPALALVLLIGYIMLSVATLANMRLQTLRLNMPRLSMTRMTPAARKATQRARSRSDMPVDSTLTDLGLIVNERRRDGQWKRRLAQVVSMDDEAIQPYVVINASADESDRVALVQFDLIDHGGRVRFSRTCEQWIRDGENLIVCDRHLPMQVEAAEAVRAGVWDLRVSVNGTLAAIHSFSVSPSTAERRRQFTSEGEAELPHMAIPVEDGPLSLEDLLREQRRSNSSGSRQ
jgi:hypothetical protein